MGVARSTPAPTLRMPREMIVNNAWKWATMVTGDDNNKV